jgi:hypothetical protein
MRNIQPNSQVVDLLVVMIFLAMGLARCVSQ